MKIALPLVRNQILVFLTYGLCALIWGTGWYAIRLSVSTGGYPVFGGAALRYTLAAIVLGMLLSFFPRAVGPVTRKQAGWLAISGILSAIGTALLYWGERIISGGLAAVLVATSPVIVAIIAFLTRTERVTCGTILGFCFALLGIALIFGERLTVSPSQLTAMSAMLGAAIFFALSSWLMKVKASEVKPMASSALFFLSMSVFCWMLCPYESSSIPWPPPAVPTFALMYLSLACSVLAFPAYVFLLRNASLMLASSLAFIHPIVALLTDSIFEKDFALSFGAYVGIAGVLLGVIFSMLSSSGKLPNLVRKVSRHKLNAEFGSKTKPARLH